MTKILEKNRNKAFKSLFTKQAFFIIIFIKASETLQTAAIPHPIA